MGDRSSGSSSPSVGHLGRRLVKSHSSHQCKDSVWIADTATDGHSAPDMLVRREDETLNALLKRLDKAIANYDEHLRVAVGL